MSGGVFENRVVREGGAVAAGQAVASIARLIGLRLVTDLVAPDVYAEVVLLPAGSSGRDGRGDSVVSADGG